MDTAPTLLGRNPLFQVPFMANCLIQPVAPLWPQPAFMYKPPLSSSEVALWSGVHFHALANATQIARKVLPRGWRQDNLWRDGHFIVALRRRYVPEANQYLGRGAWVCPRAGVWGENVVELYAHVNQQPVLGCHACANC